MSCHLKTISAAEFCVCISKYSLLLRAEAYTRVPMTCLLMNLGCSQSHRGLTIKASGSNTLTPANQALGKACLGTWTHCTKSVLRIWCWRDLCNRQVCRNNLWCFEMNHQYCCFLTAWNQSPAKWRSRMALWVILISKAAQCHLEKLNLWRSDMIFLPTTYTGACHWQCQASW